MTKDNKPRPRISGPKAISWLWDRYYYHKAKIRDLERRNERLRSRLQEMGEYMIEIRELAKQADPYPGYWKKE